MQEVASSWSFANTVIPLSYLQWFDSRQPVTGIDLSSPDLVGLVLNVPERRLFGLHKSNHWSYCHCHILTFSSCLIKGAYRVEFFPGTQSGGVMERS